MKRRHATFGGTPKEHSSATRRGLDVIYDDLTDIEAGLDDRMCVPVARSLNDAYRTLGALEVHAVASTSGYDTEVQTVRSDLKDLADRFESECVIRDPSARRLPRT